MRFEQKIFSLAQCVRGLEPSPWFLCSCDVLLVAKVSFLTLGLFVSSIFGKQTPVLIELSVFRSWRESHPAKADEKCGLSNGESFLCRAKTWYRILPAPTIAGFLVFPTLCFAETSTTVLPFFVYGTLREGYKNHDRHMKRAQRVGRFWRTREKMALFVGYYPYLVEKPEKDIESTNVVGELYTISDEKALDSLDNLGEDSFVSCCLSLSYKKQKRRAIAKN